MLFELIFGNSVAKLNQQISGQVIEYKKLVLYYTNKQNINASN